ERIAYVTDKADDFGLTPFTYTAPAAQLPAATSTNTRFTSTTFKALTAPEEEPLRDVMIEGGLWPDKSSGMLLGPDKSGKTTYALAEALSLSTGWPLFGTFTVPTPRRVFYASEEDTPDRLIRRIYDLIRLHDPEANPSKVFSAL